MATKPGILTDWPWKSLGSFKYLILAPWTVQSMYSFTSQGETKRDLTNLMFSLFTLWRILHNHIWIIFSRHRTSKGNNLIVRNKFIDFDQIDRENNWDDQIILATMVMYVLNMLLDKARHLPIWRVDGIVIAILLHMGPVEFLYYWLHRALHHHYLYSRYHSHHHASIVTQPITSVIHPFAEIVMYFLLFAIPVVTTLLTGTSSLVMIFGYVTYIDFMNNMGHCNFEFIPPRLFSIFPPLKYLMYTPSFHSLHHTQFRTNYSLFMPFYDYIYNTVDKSTDSSYKTSLTKGEDLPNVVHLTHYWTTLPPVYHLPLRVWCGVVSWIVGGTYVSDKLTLGNLTMQTWVLPRYNFQYYLKREKDAINGMIEEAILEADKKGVKVMSLGLLNQSEELNDNGEVYMKRNPKLRVKVVDGSSLVVAIVLNSIPPGTKQVILRTKINKVAIATAVALCQKGIQVATMYEEDRERLVKVMDKYRSKLILTRGQIINKVWIIGEGLTNEEQNKAKKGTLFIPISKLPSNKVRRDCFYHTTPAMIAPSYLPNLYSCENWLPRRVMSASRVAGIVHAIEGWDANECGDDVSNSFDFENMWCATLRQGFHPLPIICS